MATGDVFYRHGEALASGEQVPDNISVIIRVAADAGGNAAGAVRGASKNLQFDIERGVPENTNFTAAEWSTHPLATSTIAAYYGVE